MPGLADSEDPDQTNLYAPLKLIKYIMVLVLHIECWRNKMQIT